MFTQDSKYCIGYLCAQNDVEIDIVSKFVLRQGIKLKVLDWTTFVLSMSNITSRVLNFFKLNTVYKFINQSIKFKVNFIKV